MERIIASDWSASASTSSHTDITDYQNALTNVDSDTYAQWTRYSSTVGSNYLLFDKSELPSIMDTAKFRVKARYSGTGITAYLRSTVKYNNVYYYSDDCAVTSAAEIIEIPLPSEITPSMLQDASAFYITVYLSGTWQQILRIYGAELDITEPPKIFNLILPRG